MIAIAPTATIASIAGCYECIEPQVSNLFKRETLSGDFVQVNKYLVQELKGIGLWTDEIRNKIKLAEGSVQDIDEFNDRTKSDLPHGVGDTDAFADRHGRRPRSVYRPEPVAQPVHGKPEYRQTFVDVYVCVAKGFEDDILPAFASRDAYRAGFSAKAYRYRLEVKKTYTDEEAFVCSLENPEAVRLVSSQVSKWANALSKLDLLNEISVEKQKLDLLLEKLTAQQMVETGVTPGGWSAKDILGHLIGWQQMILSFHEAECRGEVPEVPGHGLTWRDTPKLNSMIYNEYRELQLDEITSKFESSHRRMLGLMDNGIG